MAVGTSLGDLFDDDFHYQQSLHDPDTYPPTMPPGSPTEATGALKPSEGTKTASEIKASPEPSQGSVDDRTQQSYLGMLKSYIGEQFTTDKLHAILQHPFAPVSQTITANLPVTETPLGKDLGLDSIPSPPQSKDLPALSFLRAGKAVNNAIDSTIGTLAYPEEAVQGFLEHAKNAFKLPGDVFGGKVDVNSPEGIQRTNDLANLMVFGPALVAAKMADGTLGSFAGVMAKSADMKALDAARNLAKEGTHPDEIWKQTGWFHDVQDNRWKFEIPDQNAKLKEGLDLKGDNVYHLDEVLDHPELFNAYPHLKNIPITVNNQLGNDLGMANKNGITLNPSVIEKRGGPESFMDVLNHEVQHKIQHFEGFNSGSTPARAMSDTINAITDKIKGMEYTPEKEKLYQLRSDLQHMDYSSNRMANYLYQRVPGEVEANRSMARRLLSDDQRRNWSPEEFDKFMEGSKNQLSGGNYFTPTDIPFKTSNVSKLKDLGPEKIKSAALKYGNDVFEDANHGLALGKLGDKYPDFDMNKFYSDVDQGFTTSHGRFVDREEAASIAGRPGYLISEDLK